MPVSYCKCVYSILTVIFIYSNNTVYFIFIYSMSVFHLQYKYRIFIYSIWIDFLLHPIIINISVLHKRITEIILTFLLSLSSIFPTNRKKAWKEISLGIGQFLAGIVATVNWFTVEKNYSSEHIFSHNPLLFTVLYCWLI